MRLITLDDFIDTYSKLNQRGLHFIASKFNFNDLKRAKTAFNHNYIISSNWWNIPAVRSRWNKLVTGNENVFFEDFVVNNYLKDLKNLKMLSLGSGSCYSELKFAEYGNFDEILCTDIAEIPLIEASKIAKAKNLSNIYFKVLNTNSASIAKNHYDIIYFKASLHHFKNIESLLSNLVKGALKKDGLLIIDEYVGSNRLQFPKFQIEAINKALNLIPKEYKKRFKLKTYKNKVYGSGLLRMKIADPSECIESENILPEIHKNFTTLLEANYGGNILMATLKDISHHFINMDLEKEKVLTSLFEFEDNYLKHNASDFVFGIYKNQNI
ncbi:class I SAM-dependent methyltransferase [Aestuariibaculum marinum]|uniref:Class I SAM-dependent methyltransferase n=1 Tax=Aestuariibaculum marinum TaxID=2683592 RepID=A0A8J6UA10_9FLAO|nr:class I SAM-dependent methyltransferase [Aestuariibaculum marinum]MBD0824321.1 class I SAM-dependent methyltransferase [Aestuariibaculum marinum]